jgi:hypothetical protein
MRPDDHTAAVTAGLIMAAGHGSDAIGHGHHGQSEGQSDRQDRQRRKGLAAAQDAAVLTDRHSAAAHEDQYRRAQELS